MIPLQYKCVIPHTLMILRTDWISRRNGYHLLDIAYVPHRLHTLNSAAYGPGGWFDRKHY